MFETIIGKIYYITACIVSVWGLYYLFVSLFGLYKKKRKYPIVEDKQKFCIFIPCHNEEDVIGATVENMSKIEYNPSLVDFYIIADNCKDKTARVANDRIKQLNLTNFKVLERNVTDAKKNGKPHALRWAIQLLEDKNEFYEKYDQVMILDADNFADTNILKEINSQYEFAKPNKKPCMIQCYLDSKNANNIIAKGYNYTYRITFNRINQLSTSQLGLNVNIGGTGFSITTKFLKSIGGFNAKSLTEDVEMQTIANVRGEYIYFNPYTRVYDEKPTGIKQSYIQKTRWAKGHWWVCFKYVPKLFISLFTAKSFRSFFSKIDNMLYLLGNVAITCTFVNTICAVIGFCCGYNMLGFSPYGTGTTAIIVGGLISLFGLVIYPCLTIAQDGNAKEKHLTLLKIPNIQISIFIASFIYMFAIIEGLFTWPNQGKWAKTKHVQTVNSNVDENAEVITNNEIITENEKSSEVIYMQQPLQEELDKEEADKKKVKVSVS